MQLKINIDMSNAAFDVDRRYVEVHDILSALADRLGDCDVLERGGALTLRDNNGNKCGALTVERDAE